MAEDEHGHIFKGPFDQGNGGWLAGTSETSHWQEDADPNCPTQWP